jgi:hypothetical protein
LGRGFGHHWCLSLRDFNGLGYISQPRGASVDLRIGIRRLLVREPETEILNYFCVVVWIHPLGVNGASACDALKRDL